MFMVQLDDDSYYSRLGVEPNASADDIRDARAKAVSALRRRQRREPANREELIEREKQLNSYEGVLASPRLREQYDRENAHLRFFAVRQAAAAMFLDPADRLDALHRAIVDHLRRAGVTVAPLSDLDRSEFPHDLTPYPLLDGLDAVPAHGHE
jgi:curved DNA-binding protein CbpA